MAPALTLPTGGEINPSLSTEKVNETIFQVLETGALQTINIGQLLDKQSETSPDKTAVISKWQNNKTKTYNQLRGSSRNLAAALLQLGVRPHDRIVVLAGNSLEYIELFYAVASIGAIFAIINPTFTTEEIIPTIEFLDAKAVFIADRIGYRKYRQLIADIASGSDEPSKIVQLGSTERACDGVSMWNDFVKLENKENSEKLLDKYWAKANVDDTVCIQFTSGTTGPRKAAMLTHGNFLNNALLVGERLGFTPDDVILCCSPVFHCFGLVCGIIAAFVYGGTSVLPSDVFVAEASLNALSEDKCTVVHAVPTMFQAMLDHPDAQKHAPHIKLRTGIIAGSSLSRSLLSRLSSEFNLNGLAYGYGMTELSCIAFLTNPLQVSLLDNHTSVGTVMPHTSARVVDDNLNTLPPGEAGELLVSGYLTFRGYYNNPKSTASTLVQDSSGKMWLRTGDLVKIDSEGRCTTIGRVKDMVKRGGENIYPSDVEKVLDLHPDIASSAVVGVQDAYWGEVVVAFVQHATASHTISNKEMKMWLRGRIAQHKVPEKFFWFGTGGGVPEALPVNATGKIVKKDLRDMAAAMLQKSRS